MFADGRKMQTDISRMLRGQNMINNGVTPVVLGRNTYQVPSQSGNGVYKVISNYFGGMSGWSCECPDHIHRGVECKHIHAIKFWLALKEKLTIQKHEEEQVLQAEIEANKDYNELICVYCGSDNLIKHGIRKTRVGDKTRMHCNHCNKTFTLENEAGFEKMQVSAKMVTVALDLYFKSTSLRKITDHLDQFYERKVHHTTVLFWAKKYGEIISEYAETLHPKLGTIWHADEMKLKTKREDWSWLWHVMDNETRYMVANLITKHREKEDAEEIFHKAKAHGNGTKPQFMVTDGLQSYHEAFNDVFYDHHRSSRHIRAEGLKARTNNNKVERLHNTVRERTKIMRGLQDDDTATEFNNGFKAFYNHIRPHQALNGRTPVQAAGIDLKLGRNRWLGMIRKSVEQKGDDGY